MKGVKITQANESSSFNFLIYIFPGTVLAYAKIASNIASDISLPV